MMQINKASLREAVATLRDARKRASNSSMDEEFAKVDPKGLLTREEIISRRSVLERTGYGGVANLLSKDVVPVLLELFGDQDKAQDTYTAIVESCSNCTVLLDWTKESAVDSFGDLVPEKIFEELEAIADVAETRNITAWRKLIARYLPSFVEDKTDFQQIVFNLGENQELLTSADMALVMALSKHILGLDWDQMVELSMSTAQKRNQLLIAAGFELKNGRVDFVGIAGSNLARTDRYAARTPLITRVTGVARPTRSEARALDIVRGHLPDHVIEVIFEELV